MTPKCITTLGGKDGLDRYFVGCPIKSLTFVINNLNIGIDIDGEIVSVMLYADDLVLLATKEEDPKYY